MKKFKNLINMGLLVFGFAAASGQASAQPISSTFFGQNAWMPDTIGNASACNAPPCYLNGKLHQNWQKVKESKAAVIRFGGIAPDKNRPTNYQYIKMIDSIRVNGMEPIIQVPFHKNDYTAQQAAAIVQYINVTKGKNIKYWSIGNEPDLEYGYTTAAQVAAYIKPFASAMKAVDPSIKIIGPDCAWYNLNILNGLTTPGGANDITGKDAAGRYYVDIISFHTYPYSGNQTRAEAISKLTAPNQLQDNLVNLNSKIASCNSYHNRSGSAALKTAITEGNINYQNPSNDNLNGLGVNSFFGGQFLAEMFGIGMKNSLSLFNVWSVIEGGGTNFDIGYLGNSNGNKKPAYYHYKMMAENFKGEFINATDNQTNVKAFASKTSEYTTVMLMNQDLSNNHEFTLRLNNDAITANTALKVNANAGIANEYKDVLGNQSTMLLVFNQQGVIVKKIIYSLQTHAANNQAPAVTEFSPGRGGAITSTEEQPSDENVSMKGFNINVFPNPANSKFTIELDRNNKYEVKFNIEIYDILGRMVKTQNTVFAGRQQNVDLSGQNVSEAVYIVKVREEGDKDNWKSSKVIVFK
jgi:hypothetical protein